MTEQEKEKSWWRNLRKRYQFNVMNEENYEVKSVFSFTYLNIIFWASFAVLLIGLLTYFFIAFTPIKHYIPGYGEVDDKQMALQHQLLIDSLTYRTEQNNLKLRILERVLTGDFDTVNYSMDIFSGNNDSLLIYSTSREDSILRAEVEQRERFTIFDDDNEDVFSINDISLFPPIKGVISDSFNFETGHLGIDIIADGTKEVKSTFYGTVVFAGFTVETGYIIAIQHDYNLLSLYKHNSVLNKKMGERVQQGEVIAKAGNTGELSHGEHLHFELWYNGEAIDPAKYVIFE